jgi:hypothetical protein
MKMAVFCLASIFRTTTVQAAGPSETSVSFHQTARRYNQNDSHLHTHRRENLKF